MEIYVVCANTNLPHNLYSSSAEVGPWGSSVGLFLDGVKVHKTAFLSWKEGTMYVWPSRTPFVPSQPAFCYSLGGHTLYN